MTGHPDPAAVIALGEGVLDEPRASQVRAHVAACRVCQAVAADVARVFDEDGMPESVARVDAILEAATRHPTRPAWIWLVPAAGLAAAAGVAWLVYAGAVEPPPVPERVSTAAAPPAWPSVLVPDRPLLPERDVDLTVRGGDTTSRLSLDDRIAAALDRADAGDLRGAIAAFDAIVVEHPRSAAAALSLGSVLLRDNRNSDALVALERARALDGDRALAGEIDWFLSIALVRQGDRAGARAILDGLCRSSGPRAPRACAALTEGRGLAPVR